MYCGHNAIYRVLYNDPVNKKLKMYVLNRWIREHSFLIGAVLFLKTVVMNFC